ncbi:MAG TPA: universal stress protein [Phnomibacter sp.]|nr:universal stress protein [Phnomibacter sp.]
MPSILVPIDFTPTSLNAAIYASHFGKAINARRVVLLSVVSETITGSDGTPGSSDTSERDALVLHQMEELQVSLFEIAGLPTAIELRTGDFAELMEKFIKEHSFDFVVMGVTGSNALEQVFGTSNAVEVIARSQTPVLVVPPNANFKPIENIALAVELHNLEEILPLESLDIWLHKLNPKVHIAHVNEEGTDKLSEEELTELEKLKEILLIYQPATHILTDGGFAEALNKMAIDNKIDLLFTFPQKHSFFNLLFRSTHTKQLVFHSDVPVMALPH